MEELWILQKRLKGESRENVKFNLVKNNLESV